MLRALVYRSLKKDFQSGSLQILMLALVVAIAAVSAVGFFTDRVSRAMQRQAGDLLAADLLLKSSAAIPQSLIDSAHEHGLRTALSVTFPSVVLNAEDDSQLVAVKAVSDEYPLRGTLLTGGLSGDAGGGQIATAPAAGNAQVESSLVGLLALEQDNKLLLGRSEFEVNAVILSEPDRGRDLFQMAPRVMINYADLEQAGLLIEGSRARYALMLAGGEAQLKTFRQWFDAQALPGFELQDAGNARPEIQRVLAQVDKYFGLAAMVTVLLSGAAIAMAVRQYAYQQAGAGAILRTLGASRKTVLLWMLARLLIIAVLALLGGLLLGLIAQTALASLLDNWFQVELPQAGWRPVLSAMTVTVLTLAGFASLPLLRAGTVPVLSVLRQELGGLGVSGRMTAAIALLACVLMMYLQSGDLLLVLILLFGLLLVLLVFALAGAFLYRLMRVLTPRGWSMARFVLRRRMDVTLLQLSVFGLTIMAMLLIAVVREDILQAWQTEIPDDAPNHFIVNIQPDQLPGVEALLRTDAGFKGELYPVSRGRLIAINGENAEQKFAGNERAQRSLRHEFNLSFSDSAPGHNTLLEGEWWAADDEGYWISAEKGFAERLELTVGDELTFQVAGIDRRAKILNIREVEWESFEVNFFAITSTRTLENLPTTYITSFHLPANDRDLITRLVKENPGITIIDVGKMLARVRDIIGRAALAVQSVFLFTLLAGIIVLLSAVQSSQASRMRELAVLRSMGASHKQVRQSVILEFSLLGALAGFLAAFFASAIAWLIGDQVLTIDIGINPMLWVYGTFGGALVVGVAGYLASRKVLTIPPLLALRSSLS
ncbi:MAG: FtsX-like permease family protein [Gammaproteobacteria bacterium]|nr:FtsX-like permease family protein [Gammaproteobacteria bacterium]